EQLIEMVSALYLEQSRLLHPPTTLTSPSSHPYLALTWVIASLEALSHQPMVGPSLRLSAKFYASQARGWALGHAPMLGRR
ncbi:MAG: hypothetical protein SGPRY_011292, partial [Prymnesium sp.]